MVNKPAIIVEFRNLCDVFDVRDGTHDSPKFIDNDEYALVTSKNLMPNGTIDLTNVSYISESDYIEINRRSKVDIGDLLFAMIGTIGNPTIVNFQPNFAIKNVALFKQKTNQVDVKYLRYYLQSPSVINQMLKECRGATQKFVSLKYLRNFKIPFQPLSVQYRVVEKFDRLFERIDRAISLVGHNMTCAQHLMASLLNNVLDGLDCYRMKLQDACIINPPKSEVKKIGNLEVSFLPMADLNAHQIDFIPKHIKRIAEVYTGYTYFKNGDVLLAKVTPCFENGKAGLADNLVNGIGFGSSEYYVLRAKQAVLPAYVYYNLTSSEFLRQGAQNMSGAVGLKRVTKDFLFNYEIPVPSVDVQENVVKYFANQTTKLSELKSRLEERLTELKALKSSLLDSAFKGEL